VSLKVLGVDPVAVRLRLSLKQLSADPLRALQLEDLDWRALAPGDAPPAVGPCRGGGLQGCARRPSSWHVTALPLRFPSPSVTGPGRPGGGAAPLPGRGGLRRGARGAGAAVEGGGEDGGRRGRPAGGRRASDLANHHPNHPNHQPPLQDPHHVAAELEVYLVRAAAADGAAADGAAAEGAAAEGAAAGAPEAAAPAEGGSGSGEAEGVFWAVAREVRLMGWGLGGLGRGGARQRPPPLLGRRRLARLGAPPLSPARQPP
jgi:hypothetical protein